MIAAAAIAAPARLLAISGAADSLAAADPMPLRSAETGTDAPRPAESLDLDRFADHPRVASYLRYFQGPGRATMTRWLTRGSAYLPMIRDRLAKAELPTDLGYLALIESGFRNTAVSRKGAVGMWQFMPETARAYGLRVDGRVDERRDPFKATDAAVRHLADLKDQFGSIYLAAAAYNAGAGRVSRGLERLRRSDGLGLSNADDSDPDSLGLDTDFFRLSDASLLAPETSNYVPQLIAAALIAKDPSHYDFEAPPTSSMPLDSISLRKLAFHEPLIRAATAKAKPGSLEAPRKSSRPTHVRMRRGDTVGGIARQFGVSEREVRRINALPRNYRLRPGQILRLPASLITERSVTD
jgi:soluble lytic murein transglycosylase-like protein